MRALIESLDGKERSEKVEILNNYIEKHGCSLDLMPCFVSAKYFPQAALNQLIVNGTPEIAEEAMKSLSAGKYNLGSEDFDQVLKSGNDQKVQSFIKAFRLKLNKSQVVGIANQFKLKTAITALEASGTVEEDKLTQIVINSSLSSISNYQDYVEQYLSLDGSSAPSQGAKREILSRLNRSLNNHLQQEISKEEGVKEAINEYIKVKSLIPEIDVALDGLDWDSVEKCFEAGKIDISDVDAILPIFTKGQRIIVDSKVLISNMKHLKSSLHDVGIGGHLNLKEAEEILKLKSISNDAKVRVLQYCSPNKSKILSLARKYDLEEALIRHVSGTRRGKFDDHLVEFILASETFCHHMIKYGQLKPDEIWDIYANLPKGDHGIQILKALLELPSDKTKRIRLELTEKQIEDVKASGAEFKEAKAGNKRTWFRECIEAISLDDVDRFRSYLTESYTLKKLVEDSKIATNEKKIQGVRSVNQITWINLTNEEIKALKSCGLNFNNSDLSNIGDMSAPKRSWSDSDIKDLPEDDMKIAVARATKDNDDFIAWIKKSKHPLNSGWQNDFEEVVFSCISKAKRKSKDPLKKNAELVNEIWDELDKNLDFDDIGHELMSVIAAKRPRAEVVKLLGKNHSDNLDLDFILKLSCKEGKVFVFEDSEEIPKQIIKSFHVYRMGMYLGILIEAGLPIMAKTIAKAYCSTQFKKELAQLGLTPPSQRRDLPEIANKYLGAIEKEEGESKVSLRGIKGYVRNPNAEAIREIRKLYTKEKIAASIIKAFGVENQEIIVSADESNYKDQEAVNELADLLEEINLTLLVDFSDLGRSARIYGFSTIGSSNKRILSINQSLNSITSFDGVRDIKANPYEICNYISGPESVRALDQVNITGDAAGTYKALDPNIIIDVYSHASVYILGERGQLTLERWLTIQEESAFDRNQEDIIAYAAEKLGLKVEDLPIYRINLKGRRNTDFHPSPQIGKILSEEESAEDIVRRRIRNYKPTSPSIDISMLSARAKLALIKYAIQEWELSVSFDVAQMNLEEVDSLSSVTIKTLESLSDAELSKTMGFKGTDKKIMQKVRDRIAEDGISIVQDAVQMRNLWQLMNLKESDLTYKDFFSESEDEVFCSEYSGTINSFAEELGKYRVAKEQIISIKPTSGKLRDWIRSANDNIIEDALNSIEKVIEVHRSVNSNTAKSVGVTEEQWVGIKATAEKSMEDLKEVLKNSDFGLIHDQAVKLAASNDTDMYKPEHQDQYLELESAKHSKDLKWQLFFPRVFGDTFKMGKDNGWCVWSEEHYSETVREGDAILVGIAPQGDYANNQATIDAVEALLYVVFDKRDNVSSTQIMMSKFMREDLVGKASAGKNNGYEVFGRETQPPEGRYPVGHIIDKVVEIRNREKKKLKQAA